MRSDVAFINVTGKPTVQSAVSEAMGLCRWKEAIDGSTFFLKVNLLSKEVVPGQCTSPWVFEGVLREVRSKYPTANIFFGDSDVATYNQLDLAVRRWGFDEIAMRYSAEFINLSKSERVRESFGDIFRNIHLPKILLEVDNIITIPIIKTHCLTPFTGALKNQWGLLPRVRFKYHPVVHEAIAEINGFFRQKLKMGVGDLTVSMEGPGPRVGTPKICDAIMVSTDLVALDTAVAEYMGIDAQRVAFLALCEQAGIGSRNYQLLGDSFSPDPFKPGKGKDYFVYRWRDRINNLPYIGKFILANTLSFRFFGLLAILYYRFLWYNRYGREYAKQVCRTSYYGNEFKDLIKQ